MTLLLGFRCRRAEFRPAPSDATDIRGKSARSSERKMKMPRSVVLVAAGLSLLQANNVRAQSPVDSALVTFIASIRAIDNHAHPMRPVAPGAPADSEFDALPLDGIPPFPVPRRLAADDAVWQRAQTALYGLPTAATPTDSVYRATLRGVVDAARRQRGARFPEWVLD